MGKKSRRPNRRNRHDRVRFSSSGRGLKVAIVTSPVSGGNQVSLASDVALAKAALLYADEIELVSPAAAMVSSTLALGHASEVDMLTLLASLPPETLNHVGGGQLPDNWHETMSVLLGLSTQPPDVLALLPPEITQLVAQMRTSFSGPLEELRDATSSLGVDSGADELSGAIAAGLITIRQTAEHVGPAVGDQVADYVEYLKRLLTDTSVHLLFDDASASLARSLVDEGHVQPHQLTLVHAREAAVGGGLVARLPTFPNAPMDSVLGLRDDLSGPLGRYRRAVVELAAKLSSEGYDAEMAVELDDLWRADVAPTIEELQDDLRHHRFSREFLRQTASDANAVGGALIGGVLTMGVQSFAGLDALITAVTAMAPPTGVVLLEALKAANAGSEAKREARRHDLFYLHELDERL